MIMQSRLVTLVAVIAVIALTIGAFVGYTLSSQRATSVTDTTTVISTISNSTVKTSTPPPVPQNYYTDSTITRGQVLFSNSSTTSYYTETVYHLVSDLFNDFDGHYRQYYINFLG